MRITRSLNKAILLGLQKSVDGYVRLEDFMYNTYFYNLGYDRVLKQSSLSKAIQRLREKGWVDFVDDQKLVLKLTNQGLDEALWTSLNDEGEWDGRWRIIVYDIPENRKVVRDVLRQKL